jgi:hypothetical protein
LSYIRPGAAEQQEIQARPLGIAQLTFPKSGFARQIEAPFAALEAIELVRLGHTQRVGVCLSDGTAAPRAVEVEHEHRSYLALRAALERAVELGMRLPWIAVAQLEAAVGLLADLRGACAGSREAPVPSA